MIKMNNTIYVVAPKSLFEEKYEEYILKGFDNKGGIIESTDGTKVLIEESIDMFSTEDLLLQGVMSFSREDMKAYLLDNKVEWDFHPTY